MTNDQSTGAREAMKSNAEIKTWVETELARQRQGLKDMPFADTSIFPCINLCEKLLQFINEPSEAQEQGK